jgi:hypothetical protein
MDKYLYIYPEPLMFSHREEGIYLSSDEGVDFFRATGVRRFAGLLRC